MSVFQSAYYVYDGDGNLMRGTVNGRVTFYPGRQYNQVVEGSSVTVQKFYALGSLTIAVRTIQGTQDTLNWVLGDHLGSTSVTANADGSWNSTLKYTAFGEVRLQEGGTPTEYKYTGQLEQAEIGLYYYVARWYDSELAHFVQADTIVPEPGEASTYDRYAYVQWNPIRYSDPSGHCPGTDSPEPCGAVLPQYAITNYGVRLQGTWSNRNASVAYEGVKDVGKKLATTPGTPTFGLSPTQAFRKVYKKGITFTWGTSGAAPYCFPFEGGGCTNSASSINFVSLIGETISMGGNRTPQDAFINARNNVVHELGHAFASLWYKKDEKTSQIIYGDKGPYQNIPSNLISNKEFIGMDPPNQRTWRQHPEPDEHCTSNEIFADMFLGWNYGAWDISEGTAKMDFMTTNMSVWISQAVR